MLKKKKKKNKDGNHCTHVTVLTRETTHANIYLKNEEGVRSCFYLEKSGGEWKQTTGKEFYDRLHSVVKRNEDFDHVTLNISKTHDPRVFYVNKTPEFPFAVYAANSKCRIKKIKNGWTTTIWKDRAKNKGCMYVSFYPRESPKWTYLLFLNSDGFREEFLGKTGILGRWNIKTREEYLEGIRKAGFNESTFNNHITMDLSKPSDSFHTHSYIAGSCSERLFTPLPGFLLTSVIDGRNAVWTAKDGEYCTYADVFYYNDKVMTMYLLTKGPKDDRRILYFAKVGKEWVSVDKEDYLSVTSGNDPLAPPKEVVHELTMSSFRNRQGLRLTSYASRVENAKADIILSHGIRSHFKSEFCRFNQTWIFEHFDFPTCPSASPLGGYRAPMPSDVERYRHTFENPDVEGEDVVNTSPRYGYEGSLVECLNRLGYNVYGFDLQSQGLSEAISDFKCCADDFKDYAYDVLQFISIVKRGKFSDSSEEWNDKAVFNSHDTERKVLLFGHSMSGNVVIQAVQEFYRNAKGGARLVDGLIITSPMLNVDCIFSGSIKRFFSLLFLGFIAWYKPNDRNAYEDVLRLGESFSNFSRYYDPFFFQKGTYTR
ncbi:conserved hypothetical protein [Theileria equi strain WA]|uniref:Serine aminopeptidase S33 domain-containing protein n=1 Tax=Theileria equi strain WA TaxID=1537102 RepID=L1LDR7_THEEQ|nr:conserved hypothetical protein [Theileria equi strain WA]EKX73592.1 conserved hypothetical protein [Theileria equi strain WA]|eukprot:XP_004833044.1 conserved hypothetical protein [Theileria equi strain WA]